MTKITIRSKEYEITDSLAEELKMLAFDISKLTDEIDEASYKIRTLSTLRDVLATKFENEYSKSTGASNNSVDPLTGQG